jgi:hypothetical protein
MPCYGQKQKDAPGTTQPDSVKFADVADRVLWGGDRIVKVVWANVGETKE